MSCAAKLSLLSLYIVEVWFYVCSYWWFTHFLLWFLLLFFSFFSFCFLLNYLLQPVVLYLKLLRECPNSCRNRKSPYRFQFASCYVLLFCLALKLIPQLTCWVPVEAVLAPLKRGKREKSLALLWTRGTSFPAAWSYGSDAKLTTSISCHLGHMLRSRKCLVLGLAFQ